MDNEDERGFFIDWELATIFRQSCHDRSSCPETVPYMAMYLLNTDYWTSIQRQYRHDLEGFLWILPYIFLQYNNGNLVENPPLKSWSMGNYHSCRHVKVGFLA